MSISSVSAQHPDKPALIVADTGETMTFRQLDNRSRNLARVLERHGLRPGDRVALIMENGADYCVALWAVRRCGLTYTPVNWHLAVGEVAYILSDSEAKAVIYSDALRDLTQDSLGDRTSSVARFKFGAQEPGVIVLDNRSLDLPAGEANDGLDGKLMLYSSGTTGRPKGIVHSGGDTQSFHALSVHDIQFRDVHGVGPTSVILTPGPLYHAAPLGWSMAAQKLGGTAVVFTRFDPEGTLRAIESFGVTHCQFVPIHFIRMLKLPEETRRAWDVSSLQRVLHAAAPCPIDIKEQMMAWWGPVIHEYYSGSESCGYCTVTPQEWLQRKGTVGRAVFGGPIHIVGDDGAEQPVGQSGLIYFENPRRFHYHNDPGKTAASFNEKGWGTLGDVGWVDEDGYLFLADRQAHVIVSGGVKIYPQEIESLLQGHPAVSDVAVIGVPDAEFGEQVKAVVELAPGAEPTDALAASLRDYVRSHLASFKTPRSFEFIPEMPRTPTGKLLKRKLQETYGQARDSAG